MGDGDRATRSNRSGSGSATGMRPSAANARKRATSFWGTTMASWARSSRSHSSPAIGSTRAIASGQIHDGAGDDEPRLGEAAALVPSPEHAAQDQLPPPGLLRLESEGPRRAVIEPDGRPLSRRPFDLCTGRFGEHSARLASERRRDDARCDAACVTIRRIGRAGSSEEFEQKPLSWR